MGQNRTHPETGLLTSLLGEGFAMPKGRPMFSSARAQSGSRIEPPLTCEGASVRVTRPTRPEPLIATEAAAKTLAASRHVPCAAPRDTDRKRDDAKPNDTEKPSGFFLDNALSMAGKRKAPWES